MPSLFEEMQEARRRGWFADVDEERAEVQGYLWRTFLQCPGHVVPADIWFATEEDCLSFIRNDVLGRGMHS